MLIALGSCGIIKSWLFFHRNPPRYPPDMKNIIVAPADGKVVYIREFKNGFFTPPIAIKNKKKIEISEITKLKLFDKGYVMGIFMSPLDVHVNRAPIAGTVEAQLYTPSRCVRKGNPMFEMINERNTMVIKNKTGFKVCIVQIATFLVRKIVSYVTKGENVNLGQAVGMIRLGSQVDVIMPNLKSLSFKVKEGDKVKAGETIIAKF